MPSVLPLVERTSFRFNGRFHNNRFVTEYCGKLTDIVALKTNDSYWHFLQREGRTTWGRGEAPLDNLLNTPLYLSKCLF